MALAAIYSDIGGFSGNRSQCSGILAPFPELSAFDAAVPEAQGEGRLRVDLFEDHVQGAQGQAQLARRYSESGEKCRGHSEQSGCEVPQTADRPAQRGEEKALESGRAMGSFPGPMGWIPRKSLTALAFTRGRLRDWGDKGSLPREENCSLIYKRLV